MKVMVNGGYFDVSTPYFEGVMELRHLPVQQSLLGNIEYHYYQSGHMVYVHPPTLVELHANVADFIWRTDGVRKADAPWRPVNDFRNRYAWH
jgi:carboxypeptidase C (cathepsin A)